MMNKQTLRRRAGIALALVLTFVYSGSIARAQCPVTSTQNGSIAAGDATQTGRLVRNGNPSNCNGKAFPGLQDSNPGRRFDQYAFTNTSATPICVQVTFTGTIGSLFSAAYLGSYNPANIAQNYLGDLGNSPPANTSRSYSFAVPAGATFVVVVHEITANGPANTYSVSLDCMPFPPSAPGQLLISEFRLSGPGSDRDEYIELYNNTDAALDIGGLLLRAFDPNFNAPGDGAEFIQAIPAGSVIPARGHFLVGDSGAYSLASYAALDFDTLPIFNGDFFIDNEGIQLISGDGTIIFDSVGFSGSGGRPGETVDFAEGTPLPRRTQTAPTTQYAYVRKLTSGTPQDTNDNATDFNLVDVTAAAFPLAAGGTQQSVLGAPGPERTTSPVQRNARFKASLLDSASAPSQIPNRQRFGTDTGANKAFGTLRIRRKFTNSSGASVTQLRFRVTDITTAGSPGAGAGQADLRVVSSLAGDFDVTLSDGTTQVPVKGTQVEAPAGLTQALGGGVNSSIITITPATPIIDGASVNIEFSLGVQAEGAFRFFVNVEALPGPPPAAAQNKNSRAKGSAAKGGGK